MLPERFTWSHHSNNGPDERLLRLQPGQRVVDLGCGTGTHLAFLCRAYRVHGVGIDRAPDLLSTAHTYFRGGTAEYIQTEARSWLTNQESSVDACYSRFGAVWFTNPDQLLPAIAARLRPGGRFVFSHVAPGFRPFAEPRWDFEVESWCERLTGLGFSEVYGRVWPCPDDCQDAPSPGVMIVEATR
ncbi:class I SAM-dependent methyltransferase [Saccharopolyspora shandongensis]|uniref:class I SAM-dependent methyltransferase n=1 Tax=Saccharopolyspora shandongensis TaxID=418495 RepID=UPI0034143367